MSKSNDKEIQKVVHYYENIISSMPGNVYWLDINLHAAGCNQNVLEMFGLKDINDFKGLTFEKMGKIGGWSEAATQTFKKDSLEVLRTGIPKLNIEEPPIPHRNGKLIHFLTHRVPIFNEDQEVVGVVGISIDITERKALEQSLKEANLAKDEFIRNMSHDIRTPLSGIIGMSSILEQEAQNQEEKEHAHMVNVSGEQLLTLLNSVLDIIATGSQKENQVNLAKVDCRELIHNIADLELPTITLKKLNLSLKLDDNLPLLIESDPIKIHRILLNLLGNAVKFTDTGTIEIGAGLVGDETNPCIEFYIQDSGIGIAPENLDKIFKKFFRGTASYQGIYAGHGVGLHIVKRYIQLLKGDIQVASTPGQGTRFTVRIPAKIISPAPDLKADNLANITKRALSPAPAAESKRKTKLLLIEDNAIALQTAAALLKQLDIDYETAINGQQAIEYFKQQEFDLVLSDIGLPDISGLEVARQIRAFEQENGKKPTPIYGLTAHSIIDAEPEGLQAGMNQVLSKPVRRDMLLALLESNQSTDEIANNTTQEAPLIDEEEAISILGCRETMLSIWGDFINQSQMDIQELQAAWTKQDFATVQHLAHKMKSSALYCGAVQMRDACQAMEHHFKHQSSDSPDMLYERLCRTVTKTIEVMKCKTKI